MPTFDNNGALLINSLTVSPTYLSIANKVADYTATISDQVLTCYGTLTITLPAAVIATGQRLTICNIGPGLVTVDANGVETISGSLTVMITTQWSTLEIVCTGTGWIIV